MFHDVSIIPMVNMLLFFFAGAVMSLTAYLAAKANPADVKLRLPERELTLVSP